MNYVERQELEVILELINRINDKIKELETRIDNLENRMTEIAKAKELQYNVLAFIRVKGEVCLEDLYRAFPEVDERIIRTIVAKLKERKEIERIGRGKYRATR